MSDTSSKQWIDPDVHNLFKAAFTDGLGRVIEVTQSKKWIPAHYDYPTMSCFENGRPWFTIHYGTSPGPVDYRSIFFANGANSQASALPESMNSWVALKNAAVENVRLNEYLNLSPNSSNNVTDNDSRMSETRLFYLYNPISKMIDHYIHTTGGFEFIEPIFDSLYNQWELANFLENLDFDLVVPLVMVDFDFDNLELTQNVRIERMNDSFQLSRMHKYSSGFVPSRLVAGSATHAIVLSNHWTLKNNSREETLNSLWSKNTFNDCKPIVDRILAALRIETRAETGFGQIICRPVGWSFGWTAKLLDTYPVTIRAYPDSFEDYGWLKPIRTIKTSECSFVGNTLQTITSNTRLDIGVKRLNSAFLREDESDSILDITIGLESLLAGGGKGELTYKLWDESWCIMHFGSI